jgi:hypothetical protein
VQGMAGVGKSYLIKIIDTITKLITGEMDSVIIMAPTGNAAANIGGNTLDSILHFSRRNKESKAIEAIKLSVLQKRFRNVILSIIDERSMIGLKLGGHTSIRLGQLMNYGNHEDDPVGGLPASIIVGDEFQLPPVIERANYQTENLLPIESKGSIFINYHKKNNYLLEKPIRQQEPVLIQFLNNLRHGRQDVHDLNYISKRYADSLDQEDKENFKSNKSCVVCTRKLVCAEKNIEYVTTFPSVLKVLGKDSGTLHENGLKSNLPKILNISIDMIMRLTLNINTKNYLYNQQRGTIVDIIYPPDNSIDNQLPLDRFGKYKINTTADKMPIIILDIPDYNGEEIIEGYPSYVPICPIERSCDSFCCKRFSYPLIIAKASTVHSMQGVSIGSNKFLEFMSFDYNGEKDEALWPNIAYVGMSRVQEIHNLAIINRLSISEWLAIGTTPTARRIREVVLQMESDALKKRNDLLNNNIGTVENYLDLLHNFLLAPLIHINNNSLERNELFEARKVFIDDLASELESYYRYNNVP